MAKIEPNIKKLSNTISTKNTCKMKTQINLRNGYLQPDFNPNKRDKTAILAIIVTIVAFAIYKTFLS